MCIQYSLQCTVSTGAGGGQWPWFKKVGHATLTPAEAILSYRLHKGYTVLYIVLYTVKYIMYTVQCSLYSLHCTLYPVHCTVYTVHLTLNWCDSPALLKPTHGWLTLYTSHCVRYNTVQYSTVQYSTIQNSTVQYSVQYSTEQYSIQYNSVYT